MNKYGGRWAVKPATLLKSYRYMKQTYQNAYAAIWAAAARIEPHRDTRWLNQFTYYSANMEHFLPILPTSGHLERFRQTIAFEQAGALDIDGFLAGYTPTIVEHGTPIANELATQPGLVCTTHTGAHLHIAFAMLRAGIPFAILVSQASEKTLIEKAGTLYNTKAAPPLINAEAPGALQSMIRWLQAGVSVLALVDGGTGWTPMVRSKCLKIPFLGQHVYVRRGIPYAAWTAEVPIYPVWAFRRSANIVDIHGQNPIWNQEWPKERYMHYAIATVYSHFAAYLLHHTPQWTNWWNLQRCIDANQYIRPPGRVLRQRIGLLMKAGKRFAFDRNDYSAYLLKNGKVPTV